MTPRQFYIILSLFIISTKVQVLPCLLYGELGKDGYLLILLYGLINLVLIAIVFFIRKHISSISLKTENKNLFLMFIKKLFMSFMMIYFLIITMLLYVHIKDLFANSLFDDFAWSLFSLLLLFVVIYLSRTGIKNIAYNFEIYGLIIAVSFFLIAILAIGHSDYGSLLPFETINLNAIFNSFKKFNVWFGDFFIILFLSFHAPKAKLSKTLLSYLLSISFVIFLVVTFNGIYQTYAPIEPGMILTITEQSMLGINVGRIDWFLILFAEVATILSCGSSLYFARKSFEEIIKIKPVFVDMLLGVTIYFIDIFALSDMFSKKRFFFGIASDLLIFIKILTIVVLLLISFRNLHKKKHIEVKNG